MRRISSGWTFFYKRVFPIIWFGFLVVFVGIGVVKGQGPVLVFVPIAMIGFGYFLMQKLVFDLVDEVWDDGDALVAKNGGQEQRVALSDIKNVNYSPFVNPPQGAEGRRAHWVKPELVAQIAFTEWTQDNILRNSSSFTRLANFIVSLSPPTKSGPSTLCPRTNTP